MFNHKYQIRPAFYLDPESLKRRFMVCGIIHAIFMPFLLIFLMFHFILQNVYDWKATKNYLGPRDWSLNSYWLMREFNELQHNYENRIQPSYTLADKYLSLFGSKEYLVALGRVLVFISSSLGFVLFLFAAINDSILLHVKIHDWNLLWYVGVVGGVYSTGKALLPKQPHNSQEAVSWNARKNYHRNLFGEMDDTLYEVSTHTHYYPEIWHKRGWDDLTRKSFARMFLSKTQLFLLEIISVILSPIILCISLPKCAESICEFVLAVRYEVPGTGDICGYSTFDFEKFTDERWEGRTIFGYDDNNNNPITNNNTNRNMQGYDGRNQEAISTIEDEIQQRRQPQQQQQEPSFVAGSLSESIMRTGNVHYSTQHNPKPRARHGKMEKSFFSFKAAHPSWKCSESGQHLVDRVEEYQREEEAAALSRERQLHVEAAARQLETLAQLEQLQQQQKQPPGLQVIVEDYIPKATTAETPVQDLRPPQITTAADAGAGVVAPPSRDSTVMEGRNQGQRGTSASVHPNHNFDNQSSPSSLQNVPPLSQRYDQRQYPNNNNYHHNLSINANNLHATHDRNENTTSSLGLSTEFRRFMNLSTLDPDAAAAAAAGLSSSALLMGGMNVLGQRQFHQDPPERIAERQYLWLERYHAHIASTKRQQEINHAKYLPQAQPEQVVPPRQNVTTHAHAHPHAEVPTHAHAHAHAHAHPHAHGHTYVQSGPPAHEHGHGHEHEPPYAPGEPTQAQLAHGASSVHSNSQVSAHARREVQSHVNVYARAHAQMQGRGQEQVNAQGQIQRSGQLPPEKAALPHATTQLQSGRQMEGHLDSQPRLGTLMPQAAPPPPVAQHKLPSARSAVPPAIPPAIVPAPQSTVTPPLGEVPTEAAPVPLHHTQHQHHRQYEQGQQPGHFQREEQQQPPQPPQPTGFGVPAVTSGSTVNPIDSAEDVNPFV